MNDINYNSAIAIDLMNEINDLAEDTELFAVHIAKDIFEKNKHHLGALFLHSVDKEMECIAHIDLTFVEDEEGVAICCDNELDSQLLIMQQRGSASMEQNLVYRIFELAGKSVPKDKDGKEREFKRADYWLNPLFNDIIYYTIVENSIAEEGNEFINQSTEERKQELKNG